MCRKQLASTFLDPKIAKESISAIESCHRSRADALQDHFQPTSIYNCQQPDHACINFCLSHSENSVQMHACMICRSEFSPEWLNQRMHGHRPARIRSGGCMTGNRKILIVQKIAGHHFSIAKNRQGIHFCHRKLPQIARWRAVRAFSDDIDLKQANSRIMHA